MLWVLLALALTRGLLYATLNPPLASPDERSHMDYVASVAAAYTEPGLIWASDRYEQAMRGEEGHQPQPYYLLMVPAFLLAQGGDEGTRNLAVRLSSLPFLAAIVLLTWLAGRRLAPKNLSVAVLATSMVALHPQLAYVTASANNDAAANVMGAVITYLLVTLVAKPRRWVFVGLLVSIGVGLMTKGQLLPVVGIAAVTAVLRLMPRAGVTAQQKAVVVMALVLVVVIPLGGTSEGAWLLKRTSDTLVFLGGSQGAMQTASRTGPDPLYYEFYSFWAAFIGESVRPASAAYVLPASIVGVGLLGSVWNLLANRRVLGEIQRRTQLCILLLGGIIAAQWLALYIFYLSNVFRGFAWDLQVLQGRYLFVVVVPLSLLVAAGWTRILGDRARTIGVATVLSLLAAFDVASLMALASHYGWPLG